MRTDEDIELEKGQITLDRLREKLRELQSIGEQGAVSPDDIAEADYQVRLQELEVEKLQNAAGVNPDGTRRALTEAEQETSE